MPVLNFDLFCTIIEHTGNALMCLFKKRGVFQKNTEKQRSTGEQVCPKPLKTVMNPPTDKT